MDIKDIEYLEYIYMKKHDLIIIKDYQLATIETTTPKAICVSFKDKNHKCNTWIPKKLIEIIKKENTKKHYREIEVFHISLPQWFKDKNKMYN